jgi:hypothetical protein
LVDLEEDGINRVQLNAEILASMAITNSAFKEALDHITPVCKARQSQAIPSAEQPAATPEHGRAKN